MLRARGFANSGARIAYEVVGSGADALVVTPPWLSHLDYDWETPEVRAYYEALAAGRRVVRYDKRGTGLSEREVGREACSPEIQMHDCLAVLDAAGVARASFLVVSEGGPMAITLATRHRDRVDRLILYGCDAPAAEQMRTNEFIAGFSQVESGRDSDRDWSRPGGRKLQRHQCA